MTTPPAAGTRRLLIIGAGSSGLITLKYACELLTGWEIECFEQSDGVTGAWGNPYEGFVSTSTKYTTQFASYRRFDASVCSDGGASRSEFFRDGEYGEYLTRFADHFGLRGRVAHGRRVLALARAGGSAGWEVTYAAPDAAEPLVRRFDAVVICTGLVAEPRSLGDHPRVASLPTVMSSDGLREITGKTVVVVGGGEMATDFANRLAQPGLGNRVFLSLRSGIRVSPRYHPIRGVPSDFLRNRLMLSIHVDIRNWIGARFVAARIRYRRWFERVFPPRADPQASGAPAPTGAGVASDWSKRLNRRAERGLFDMFHNKSDDFLTAIAEGRLDVVGAPLDASFTTFGEFDAEGTREIAPDVVVPAVGFRSRLGRLSDGAIELRDFYLGCRHIEHDDLFLVGFARPVIGNIPSISEIQARYVVLSLAGQVARPSDIVQRHAVDAAERRRRFAGVDTNLIYPVEMFPYCDRLAREMGVAPRPRTLRERWAVLTAPATTLDYACFQGARDAGATPPTYLPASLIFLLFLLKPLDWAYRAIVRQR
ncbi:Ferredoxin--NADP reductase [Pirellulimonas nuda]|uniref:Ferredoxin--NADP reductase n=1 Tax=Pirellulimonas nuda TaxID=2528009 RepID=A0A518DCJ0_9BACT|nr:FAD/NAD(P)-binding protein [Pirellulimonas nuda]QDU89201.1 Ferredoxin--NADP reductase [Pirellulimonas nuda]